MKKHKMTKKQEEALEDIYEDSIDKLTDEWERAREANEPDIVLDEIWSEYEEQLKQIFKVKDLDEVYTQFDFGPRDMLYEMIDAGIN